MQALLHSAAAAVVVADDAMCLLDPWKTTDE
jgi:hypothetical protein